MCATSDDGRDMHRSGTAQPTHRTSRGDGSDRFTLGSAFGCAWAGIVHAVRTQRNVKIQLVFAPAAVVLGLVLRISGVQWCVIVVCIMVVLGLELVNTALEAVVDLASPSYHELARIAKDCAAGAVLLCAIGSVVIALIIFVPRFLELLGM